MALTWQERGEDAETILAELADQASGPLRGQVALLRALNFAGILGQTASAERELETPNPPSMTPRRRSSQRCEH